MVNYMPLKTPDMFLSLYKKTNNIIPLSKQTMKGKPIYSVQTSIGNKGDNYFITSEIRFSVIKEGKITEILNNLFDILKDDYEIKWNKEDYEIRWNKKDYELISCETKNKYLLSCIKNQGIILNAEQNKGSVHNIKESFSNFNNRLAEFCTILEITVENLLDETDSEIDFNLEVPENLVDRKLVNLLMHRLK